MIARLATTTAALAVLTTGTVGISQAHPGAGDAAGRPGFLSVRDLPASPGDPYTAGSVKRGAPKARALSCLAGAVPDGDATWHRHFSAESRFVVQVVVRESSEARAAELASRLKRAITRCGAEFLAEYPDGFADVDRSSKIRAGDGGRAYRVALALKDDPHGRTADLFGVGRDGRIVTAVLLDEALGYPADTSLSPAKRTTATAIRKLR